MLNLDKHDVFSDDSLCNGMLREISGDDADCFDCSVLNEVTMVRFSVAYASSRAVLRRFVASELCISTFLAL